MLKRKVLVTGISNLSEARYCAGMFVDYLCFELNKTHEDYISLEKVLEIKNWLSGLKVGGRVAEWPSDMNEEAWQKLGLDFLIIADAGLTAKAKEKVSELFFEVTSANDSEKTEAFEHILLNSPELPQTSEGHPSIFAGNNIALSELDDILENENFQGIALKGSLEISPGVSNYDDLMDVLEALDEDF